MWFGARDRTFTSAESLCIALRFSRAGAETLNAMTEPTRFTYRLDPARFEITRGRIFRRTLLLLTLLVLALAAYTFTTSTLIATALTAICAVPLVVLARVIRGDDEVEGIKLTGAFEPTRSGLLIHYGRSKSRLKPWHAFQAIVFDPVEGTITFVPDLGFAISIYRDEVKDLDAFVDAIRRFAKIELESAREDDVSRSIEIAAG